MYSASKSVLKATVLVDLGVVCYADDTLVLAREENCGKIIFLAEAKINLVVSRICQLRLEMAPQKINAISRVGGDYSNPS